MAFQINWSVWDRDAVDEARRQINRILESQDNFLPPVCSTVQVVDMNMGTQAPEVALADIHTLSEDKLEASFTFNYAGDAAVRIHTLVQPNYVAATDHPCSAWARSNLGLLAAHWPAVLPFDLVLSEFRLYGKVLVSASPADVVSSVSPAPSPLLPTDACCIESTPLSLETDLTLPRAKAQALAPVVADPALGSTVAVAAGAAAETPPRPPSQRVLPCAQCAMPLSKGKLPMIRACENPECRYFFDQTAATPPAGRSCRAQQQQSSIRYLSHGSRRSWARNSPLNPSSSSSPSSASWSPSSSYIKTRCSCAQCNSPSASASPARSRTGTGPRTLKPPSPLQPLLSRPTLLSIAAGSSRPERSGASASPRPVSPARSTTSSASSDSVDPSVSTSYLSPPPPNTPSSSNSSRSTPSGATTGAAPGAGAAEAAGTPAPRPSAAVGVVHLKLLNDPLLSFKSRSNFDVTSTVQRFVQRAVEQNLREIIDEELLHPPGGTIELQVGPSSVVSKNIPRQLEVPRPFLMPPVSLPPTSVAVGTGSLRTMLRNNSLVSPPSWPRPTIVPLSPR